MAGHGGEVGHGHVDRGDALQISGREHGSQRTDLVVDQDGIAQYRGGAADQFQAYPVLALSESDSPHPGAQIVRHGGDDGERPVGGRVDVTELPGERHRHIGHRSQPGAGGRIVSAGLRIRPGRPRPPADRVSVGVDQGRAASAGRDNRGRHAGIHRDAHRGRPVPPHPGRPHPGQRGDGPLRGVDVEEHHGHPDRQLRTLKDLGPVGRIDAGDRHPVHVQQRREADAPGGRGGQNDAQRH